MATSASGTPGSQPKGPGGMPIPQFFVDVKKGEVNELRLLLRAVSLDKDPVKKRDIIKKPLRGLIKRLNLILRIATRGTTRLAVNLTQVISI